MAGKKPLNKGLEALLGDVKKTPTTKKPTKEQKPKQPMKHQLQKLQKTNTNQELFLMMKSLKTLQAPLKNMELFNP